MIKINQLNAVNMLIDYTSYVHVQYIPPGELLD